MSKPYLKKFVIHPRISHDVAVSKGMEYYFPLGTSPEFNPIFRGVYRTSDKQPMEEIDSDYKHSKYNADPANYDDNSISDTPEPHAQGGVEISNIVKSFEKRISYEFKKSKRDRSKEQKVKSLESKLKKLNTENIELKKKIEALTKANFKLKTTVREQ